MDNCYVCGGILKSMGTVPFDRNNVGAPVINERPVEYVQCTKCHSILCPEIMSWTPEQFSTEIYNEDYITYDPEYINDRPVGYAKSFSEIFSNTRFTHLDYGSGSGIMSKILAKDHGWKSTAYDPYSGATPVTGKFDLITAIEVFEHSTNTDTLIETLNKYLNRDGVIIFSTLLAYKEHTIEWGYIAARNGHINMLSSEAMKRLASKHGLFFSSIDANIHVLQKTRSSLKRLIDG